jgi:hypothetical protein
VEIEAGDKTEDRWLIEQDKEEHELAEKNTIKRM